MWTVPVELGRRAQSFVSGCGPDNKETCTTHQEIALTSTAARKEATYVCGALRSKPEQIRFLSMSFGSKWQMLAQTKVVRA